MTGIPYRTRLRSCGRLAALLTLALQLLLAALPHTERVAGSAPLLRDPDTAALGQHPGTCLACVAAHGRAAPAAVPLTPTASAAAAPPIPAPPSADHSTTRTTTRSRAPPRIAA